MGSHESGPDRFHPRDSEAAEYAIGTLASDERAAFRTAMDQDAALAGVVRGWEERLAALSGRVPPVEPSRATWAGISARLAGPVANVVAFPSEKVARLRLARSRWRAATIAAGSIAAMLAAFIAVDRGQAQRQPALMAVVNRSGDLPALVVRVDQRAGVIQVRSLATETPADRSLELWSIVRGGQPQSLGLAPGTASRIELPSARSWPGEGTTIAVSLEPRGGSPTGAPTGPVVYSGRLVADVP